jgi:hypothetical protein
MPVHLTPGAFEDAGRIADADLAGDSGSGAVFILLREQVVVRRWRAGSCSCGVVVVSGFGDFRVVMSVGGGVPAASSVMRCMRTASVGWLMRCLTK